jgi:4-alpha-glucanotransferase
VPGVRTSGILLHPTSLPGAHGIGDLGPAAFRFVDFLAAAGQSLWQVLPLGPTGYGDSPYQCFSAFAGNPLLVSLDLLRDRGLLEPSELTPESPFPEQAVDYGAVIAYKRPPLARAATRFFERAPAEARQAFDRFCRDNAAWLDDFALFMAVKDVHGGAAWTEWEPPIAAREPEAVDRWSREQAGAVRERKFEQFAFFEQWAALRARCRRSHVKLMGDVPIFVAHDSADVWAHRDLFQLGDDGRPTVVAGVPPDYFSATGQLWGNPLYRWDVLAGTGYRWWIDRLRAALRLVDLVRLDHFRGFEAHWEVPGGADTAVGGRWVNGPGAAFFQAVRRELGPLPIVAENLGVITPEVEALRHRFHFPGMAILQFAFGTDPQGSGFRPHNYTRDLVVYTGTHDNDTTVGWWRSTGEGDSTRAAADVRAEKDQAFRYLDAEGREIHWAFIRAALASVADTAIIPLQDVLGLGSEARMNLPGRPSGNWRWRVTSGALADAPAARLRELTELYGRLAGSKKRPEPDRTGGES